MSRIVIFEIWGENFSPKKIDLSFNSSNEVGEVVSSGFWRGKAENCGSASFAVPKEVDFYDSFKYLADKFEPILPDLELAGATQWWIYIGRLYYAQCNEELSYKEVLEIARLKCSVSYSAFSVSAEEEELGFNIEKYYSE